MIRLSDSYIHRNSLIDMVIKDYCDGRKLYTVFSKRARALGVPMQDFPDVFQDFVLKLCDDENNNVFYDPNTGKTMRDYLCGSFSNQCMSYHRRKNAIKRIPTRMPGRSTETEPSSEAEKNEERELLYSAINRLPEEQRYSVVQRYFEDQNRTAIGSRLGTDSGVVKRLLNSARAELRLRLPESLAN